MQNGQQPTSQNTQVEEQQPSQQAVDTSSVANTTPQNITKLKLVSIDPYNNIASFKAIENGKNLSKQASPETIFTLRLNQNDYKCFDPFPTYHNDPLYVSFCALDLKETQLYKISYVSKQNGNDKNFSKNIQMMKINDINIANAIETHTNNLKQTIKVKREQMTFTETIWKSLCEGEIKQLQNEYNDSYVIEVQIPPTSNGGSKSRKSTMRKTKKSKKSRKSRKTRKH